MKRNNSDNNDNMYDEAKFSVSSFNRSTRLGIGAEQRPMLSMSVKYSTNANNDGANVNASSSFSSGLVNQRQSITLRLRPTLRLLQLFGYFPGSASSGKEHLIKVIFWRTFGLVLLAINTYIVAYTVTVAMDYYSMVGMLHAFTVTSVITGLKPLVNCVNMLIYYVGFGRHRQLLQSLEALDHSLRGSFACEPLVGVRNLLFFAATAVVFAVFASVRTLETILTGMPLFGHDPMNTVGVFMVPLISLWGTIPLFYFLLIEDLILYWSRKLRAQLELDLKRYDLKFYYRKFLQLCNVQEAAGGVFGPWILASLGWSVFTLCLTIYFMTQADTFLELSPKIKKEILPDELPSVLLVLRFNVCYSVLQISVAALHIFGISYKGAVVNEETRLILKSVLQNVPEDEVECDRFQVTCFMYKMQTQYSWGVTVWRAFPVERGAFFTMSGLIVSYAILLLKFRSSVTEYRPMMNGTDEMYS